MDIGEHCYSCGRLDFLPYDCNRCGNIFCGDHRMHDCIHLAPQQQYKALPDSRKVAAPPAPQARTARLSSSEIKQNTTSKTLGASRELNSAAAAAAPTRPLKGVGISERAAAVLERLSLKPLRRQAAPSKSTSAAVAVVETSSKKSLLELKKQATGDAKVVLQNRLYVWVQRLPSSYKDILTGENVERPAKTVALYFDRAGRVGPAADRAAQVLGVPNGKFKLKDVELDTGSKLMDVVSSGKLLLIV